MVHVFLLGESPYFLKKKIAAIVLDLISYFDANISRLVQSTLPKTLKCVSFLSQKWTG